MTNSSMLIQFAIINVIIRYLLFAADPYETIAFKIPNKEIERGESRFFTHWDRDKLVFTLQLFFKERQSMQRPAIPPMPVVGQRA